MKKALVTFLIIVVLAVAGTAQQVSAQEQEPEYKVYLPEIHKSQMVLEYWWMLFEWEDDFGAMLQIGGFVTHTCIFVSYEIKYLDEPVIFRDMIVGGGGIQVKFTPYYEPCDEETFSPFFEYLIRIESQYILKSYIVWVDDYCIIPTLPCRFPLPEEFME